jgi:hypothetical protein
MTTPDDVPPPVEADPRFPSGPWEGFFLQPILVGRHRMELSLTFSGGVLRGDGRDRIGLFLMRGRYDLKDGQCWWTKSYIGKHDIFYRGYNEGKGIWGRWESPYDSRMHGGFHIWPVGQGFHDPSRLVEAIDLPVAEEVAALEAVGV